MKRRRKVSAETIAKRNATRAANKAKLAEASGTGNVKDALIMLRKASKLIMTKDELSDSDLYVLCAKRCLEGGMR